MEHHTLSPVPCQVAQRYVSNPLLLLGRKFHLRLWVLVATNSPLRAYLHRYAEGRCPAIGAGDTES